MERFSIIIITVQTVLLLAAGIYIIFTWRYPRVEPLQVKPIHITDDMTDKEKLLAAIFWNHCKVVEALYADFIRSGGMSVKFTSAIRGSLSKHNDFMDTVVSYFNAVYPDYIHYLQGVGFDHEELFISCLMSLGISSKSLMSFTGDRHIYAKSSSMRKKLSLNETDNNLNLFLRQTRKKMYPQS